MQPDAEKDIRRSQPLSLLVQQCHAAEYSSLASRAIKILLPKQRNRLYTEHDLRVALSTIVPDFEALIRSKKHPQFSH